jgi:hypothetical protein
VFTNKIYSTLKIMRIRTNNITHQGHISDIVRQLGHQALILGEVESIGMMEMGMFLLHQVNLHGALLTNTGPPI